LSRPIDLVPFRPPLERFRSAKLTVLRSFVVEVDLAIGADAAGVIVAHGDQGGGYLLAIDEGAPLLVYNAYGVMHRARGARLSPGAHRIVLRVDEHSGLRWRLTVDVDGDQAASIDHVPMLIGMSPFTGISVGYDYGGPVDWELHERHRSYGFQGGELRRVRYVPGARSPHDATVLRAVGRAVLAVAD
jgi:arylsulfatase